MKRAIAYVNVAPDGGMGFAWSSKERADEVTDPNDRIAECHELRPGESIVTAEMRREIEAFTGDLWPKEVRDAATAILGILDGEKSCPSNGNLTTREE